MLWLMACCCACTLWGQTYRGTVLERDGKTPITGVNVCLLSAKGLPVAWNYTDSKGAFSVTHPHGKNAESIRLSLLGYKKL